jgi:very-short-patch-repair endonuclease
VLIADVAASQHGTISFEQLLACGLSRQAILRRVQKGWLHSLYRAVYAVGHANVGFEGRMFAATLASGRGSMGARLWAAVAHGMEQGIEGKVQVLVVGRDAPVRDGIDARSTELIDPVDVGMWRGIPVTSPTRTLVDLAADVGEDHITRMLRTALGKKLTSLPQILETKHRLGPRPGSKLLAKVLATKAQPTRSELENVVLDLILDAGFSEPEVNVPMVIEGRTVIPDFRWPSARLVVEADGAAWHEDNAVARLADRERQRLIEANGDRVERVTWNQAIRRRCETVARVAAAGAPYAGTGSSSAMRN